MSTFVSCTLTFLLNHTSIQLFTKHFTIEDYDKRDAQRGQGNEQYHTKKMEPYPGNFHYWKNIKLIGGADTNAEKHISEY